MTGHVYIWHVHIFHWIFFLWHQIVYQFVGSQTLEICCYYLPTNLLEFCDLSQSSPRWHFHVNKNSTPTKSSKTPRQYLNIFFFTLFSSWMHASQNSGWGRLLADLYDQLFNFAVPDWDRRLYTVSLFQPLTTQPSLPLLSVAVFAAL